MITKNIKLNVGPHVVDTLVSEEGRVWYRGKLKSWCDNGRGYKTVILTRLGHQKRFYVHRLVAMAFLGEVEGRQINHLDFDRANNNVSNLEVITAQENLRYSREAGRRRIGISYPIYLEILRLHYREGMAVKTICGIVGKSRYTVRGIIIGKSLVYKDRYLREGNPYDIRIFKVEHKLPPGLPLKPKYESY